MAKEQGRKFKLQGRTLRRSIITAVLFVIIGFIVFFIERQSNFSHGQVALITAILAVVVIFGYPLIAGFFKSRAEVSDTAKTCDPILKRYTETLDADEMMASYEEWQKGEHSENVRMQFAQAVADYLVQGGHLPEARKVMYGTDKLELTKQQREALDVYKADFEDSVKSARENNAINTAGGTRRQRRRRKK